MCSKRRKKNNKTKKEQARVIGRQFRVGFVTVAQGTAKNPFSFQLPTVFFHSSTYSRIARRWKVRKSSSERAF